MGNNINTYMGTMHNIKDYDTYLMEIKKWNSVQRKRGYLLVNNKIRITDKDDIDDISQTIKRSTTDDMKKLCGGVRKFEVQYENGIINPLYNKKSQTFSELIEESPYGYYKIDPEKPISDIFNLKGGTVGKGEVLMSCLFPDVKLTRRKFKDDESDRRTPDCEFEGGCIEVKTGGSEFRIDKSVNNYKKEDDTIDYTAYCVDKISEYILSRYNKQPLVFVCFDNSNIFEGVNTMVTPNGFFWIKYEGDTESLKKNLKDVIIISEKSGEHKNRFSIVAKRDEVNPRIICYNSLFKNEE